MDYFDLLSKVPEHLKEISEFRTTGVKPNGKLSIGFGLADKVGEESLKFGVGKALLVTDKLISNMGLHKISLNSPVTMPPRVTASTGLDALTHGIEGLIGKPNPFSEILTNKCVEHVFAYLERAYINGEDLEARYYMSLASVLGMMSYTQGGGLYAHSMSYIMTIHHNIPHGMGCGMSLPYTLMFNFDFVKNLLAKFSNIIDPDYKENESKLAMNTVEKIYGMLIKLGIPVSLNDINIEKTQLASISNDLVEKYYRTKNPRSMNNEESYALVESMWEGKLKTI